MGSKSQGGELDARVTPSGDEDYYNVYLYYDAWNYKGENIGNNFFTNRRYARTNLPNRAGEYVINSRVLLFHLGFEGWVNDWQCTAKLSYSRNYGTYGSSPIGNTTGTIRSVGPPPYFEQVNQFSGYIQATRDFREDTYFTFGVAVDQGKLLYNSVGGFIKVGKFW